MALTLSELKSLFAVASGKIAGDLDNRGSEYGGIQSLNYTPNFILPNEIQKLQVAEKTATDIPYLPKKALVFTDGNILCDFPAEKANSNVMNLTWRNVTPSLGFAINKDEIANNVYKEAELMAYEMQNFFNEVYKYIDSDIIAFLEANRTAINAYSLFVAPAVSAVRIPNADKGTLYQKMKVMMKKNDYSMENNVVVSNTESIDNRTFFEAQGSGNATNFGYQFSGFDRKTSNRVLNDVNTVETHYAFQKGSVAMIPWSYGEFFERNGTTNKSGINGDIFYSMPDVNFPSLLKWTIHRKQNCTDADFAGFSNRPVASEVVKYQMSCTYCLSYAPLTGVGASPIHKVELRA
jgi:hypothetical protein